MLQRPLWRRALCQVRELSRAIRILFFHLFHNNLTLYSFFASCLFTGGGVALLYASKELDKISTANEDEKIGVQIIKNALKVTPTV
jgi:chaperonin GroEL (HSP60 family)